MRESRMHGSRTRGSHTREPQARPDTGFGEPDIRCARHLLRQG